MATWISKLFFGPGGGALPQAFSSGSIPLVSPFASESNVHALVASDLYGVDTGIVDRATAMRVPPIKRGRAIIVGSIADLPLESGSFDGETWVPAARQPLWLTQSTSPQTPWHRMAHTLDDLIFNGWSVWALARTEAGTVVDAIRVNPARWKFDQDSPTGLAIDNKPVTDPRSVILFQGPDEGVLSTGADTIRGALSIEKSWVGRVRNPIPLIVLHEVSQNSVTQEEAQELVTAYSNARRSPDGSVSFLPAGLNLETHGTVKPDLFIEGRNAVRLDVANLLNLPASLLDGSTATASLTYVTQEGQRGALIDWLEFWLAPIEARLSQDDVTPHGQVVRFDRSNLTSVPNDTHGPELLDETPDSAEPAPEEVTNDAVQ